MSQSKPSSRSSNKGQCFDKNHSRVEVTGEESTLTTKNEEVISTVGRTDTSLVGTDEADKSDLDDHLISTGFTNTGDNDSDNNSGRNEEISDNEEEDDEEESQGGDIIASENRTPTDETPVETGEITEAMRGPDRDPATISRNIYSISRVIYTLTTENITRTHTQ